MVENSIEISPFGWYVGSYLLRFIELSSLANDAPDGEFLVWENTVIVRAGNLDEAFEKVTAVAKNETAPYESGSDSTPVQWVFEGITELLPIYDPLEDGAEIMWAEHESIKLSELRKRAKTLGEIRQHMRAKRA